MHVEGERHFYERRTERGHLHITCIRCGKVTEFKSILFAKLKKQVEEKCHFRIVVVLGDRRLLS